MQPVRGFMDRLYALFRRNTLDEFRPPDPPFEPINISGVGPITTREEYNDAVRRIAATEARLKRAGYEVQTTMRRVDRE